MMVIVVGYRRSNWIILLIALLSWQCVWPLMIDELVLRVRSLYYVLRRNSIMKDKPARSIAMRASV